MLVSKSRAAADAGGTDYDFAIQGSGCSVYSYSGLDVGGMTLNPKPWVHPVEHMCSLRYTNTLAASISMAARAY